MAPPIMVIVAGKNQMSEDNIIFFNMSIAFCEILTKKTFGFGEFTPAFS